MAHQIQYRTVDREFIRNVHHELLNVILQDKMGWHSIRNIHDEVNFNQAINSRNDAPANFEGLAFHHHEKLVYVASLPQSNYHWLFDPNLYVVFHDNVNWLDSLCAKKTEQATLLNAIIAKFSFIAKHINKQHLITSKLLAIKLFFITVNCQANLANLVLLNIRRSP
jgi:hypothetical protein